VTRPKRPVYGDREQFATLLEHIAAHVDNEPDVTFADEKVRLSARDLYERLGSRLREVAGADQQAAQRGGAVA
jgi:hypothetical protein